MALYPGAVYKPTPHGGKAKRNKQGRGILHVAVSNARSLPPWNSNTWHFYVAKDGYCEQYIDTEYRAATSGTANDDAIGIETAGGLGSSAVLNAEKWTPQQVARLADIIRWEAQQPGGAPIEQMPDAKPGRRGWGPHRLGIKHSGGPRPGWWQPGSEQWSSVLGKECPGDAKVAQIPHILALAKGGAAIEEDDMFTDQDRKDLGYVKATLDWFLVPDDDPKTAANESAPNSKGEVLKRIRDTHGLAAAIASRNPQAIAAEIPADLAAKVADELGKRLNT